MRRSGVAITDDYDANEISTFREHLSKKTRALCRGNENPHVTMLEDIGDLSGLQYWVHRHEYAPGCGSAEERDNGFELLWEINGDAIGWC